MTATAQPGGGRPDADQFLERVEASLRMPPHAANDVVEELWAHISDAIDALTDEGLGPDAAEREALARLGSPEELGDRIRRAHQSRRRLMAAAGGGLWDGLQEGVKGIFVGSFVGGFALFAVAALVAGVVGQGSNGLPTQAATTLYSCVAIWVGAWWLAREMVRAVSRRSRRRIEDVRPFVALAGAAVLGVLVTLWRAEHTWGSVVAVIAIPILFAIAATTTEPDDDQAIWFERPSPAKIRVALGSLALMALVISLSIPTGSVPDGAGAAQCCDGDQVSDEAWWASRGYAVVAPNVIDVRSYRWSARGPDGDGVVLVTLADDSIDWDEWPDLRVEAWRASPRGPHDIGPILPGFDGPYAVAALEPWATPAASIRLGSTPGVAGYRLFVTAIDPATGIRVAFGQPEGDTIVFVGNLIDWFAAVTA